MRGGHIFRYVVVVVAVVFLDSSLSLSQEEDTTKYPSRAVTLIDPITPGGPTDLAIRLIAKEAEKILGQPVVVVNKTGGAGSIGIAALATSKPDGYTIGYLSHSGMYMIPFIQEVMIRNKYYHQDWAPEGVDKNILEKRLGATIEPKGLFSFNKLLVTPDELNDDDTANIVAYLQFQRIRVPRQADMARAMARTALELHLSESPDGREVLRLGTITIKDSFRIYFMRAVSRVLCPYFSKMVWEIIHAPDGVSFVTSDSPVSFYNIDFPPPTEAGIGLYGTMVFFPINKGNLLLMRHPEYQEGKKRASDRLPKDLDCEDGFIEIRKDIVWNSESVRRANWTMFNSLKISSWAKAERLSKMLFVSVLERV